MAVSIAIGIINGEFKTQLNIDKANIEELGISLCALELTKENLIKEIRKIALEKKEWNK